MTSSGTIHSFIINLYRRCCGLTEFRVKKQNNYLLALQIRTLSCIQWQQKSTMATSQCRTRILEADVGSNREVVETVRFRRNSSSSFHWILYWRHRGRWFEFGLTRAVFVQVSDTPFETVVVCAGEGRFLHRLLELLALNHGSSQHPTQFASFTNCMSLFFESQCNVYKYVFTLGTI